MNNKKPFLVSIAAAIFFIIPFVFIGSVPVAHAFSVVAQVGIVDINSTYVPANGSYTISFDIQNGPQIQTGVRYGVTLAPELGVSSSTAGVIIDQKVYDETLTLLPNTTTARTVSYTPPPYLEGKYRMLIISKDDSGLPLSSALVSEVSLKPASQGIFVDPSSCYLSVASSSEGAHYTLSQGVDILPSETLDLSCQATNLSSTQTEAAPAFQTNLRTNFGGSVAAASVNPAPGIIFAADESKLITVAIPEPADPQAYDSVFNFTAGGAVISNQITAHWVLRGASATIQDVNLDKTYYYAGDVATVSFVWTGSADSFAGSRLGTGTALGVITAQISVCGDTKDISLSGTGGTVLTQIPITDACAYPSVSVSIFNNGTQLSDASSTISDPEGAKVLLFEKIKEHKQMEATIALTVGLLAIVLIIALRLKNKKKLLRAIAFLFVGGLTAVGVFGIKAPAAHASTYSFVVKGSVTYVCQASTTLAGIVSSLPSVTPSIGVNGKLSTTPGYNYDYKPGQDVYLNTTATTSSAIKNLSCSYSNGYSTTTLTQANGGLTLAASYGLSTSATFTGSLPNTSGFSLLFPNSLLGDSLMPVPSNPAVAGSVFAPGMYLHLMVSLYTVQGIAIATSSVSNSAIYVGPLSGNTVTLGGAGVTWDQGTVSGIIDPTNGNSLFATVALSNGEVQYTNQFYPGSGIGFVDDFTTAAEGCTNGATEDIFATFYIVRSSDGKIIASTTPTDQYQQNQFDYLIDNEQNLLATGSYYLQAVFTMYVNLYHVYVDPNYVLGTLIIPFTVSPYPLNLSATASAPSVAGGNATTSVTWNNIVGLFPLNNDQGNGAAMSYKLYRSSPSTTSTPVLVTTINNVTQQSGPYQYTDSGLQPGTPYYYFLQLVDNFSSYDPNPYGGLTWVPPSSPVLVTTGQYSAAPPSSLCSITSSPGAISAGQQSTLTWSSSGSSSCSINGSPVASTSGSSMVSPSATTNYGLQCQSAGSSPQWCSATTTVNVTGNSGNQAGSVTLYINGGPTASIATSTSGSYPSTLGVVSWSSVNDVSCSNVTSVPAGYFSNAWNGSVTSVSSNSGNNDVGPFVSIPSVNPVTYSISCIDINGNTNTSSARLTITGSNPNNGGPSINQTPLCQPILNAALCPYEGTSTSGLNPSKVITSSAACTGTQANPQPTLCEYYCNPGFNKSGSKQCVLPGTIMEK